MKILYVASNLEDAPTLQLEREITELQRRISAASTELVLVTMPHLRFEELPGILHHEEPDILHLSAHGDNRNLTFINEASKDVQVTADMLRTFMSDRKPPRLAYVNSCDSVAIAEGLVATVPMAIGNTAPISNLAARAAAIAFYERILDGASIQRAFEVTRKIMEGSSGRGASIKLLKRAGVVPAKEFVHAIPRLIAEFITPKATSEGFFRIRFGLAGCPFSTTQIVFFTDEPDFVPGDYDDETAEEELCLVVRTLPENGVVWAHKDQAWPINGNIRLFAAGATSDGKSFTAFGDVCEALEARYRLKYPRGISQSVLQAIAALRRPFAALD